ncbi:hypothetical protein L208DRAFT_1439324 [Tricholoma matsutake]|nr:hypothetical protein L208DRAFT_1439324 [Tricholoma matsutake 945]
MWENLWVFFNQRYGVWDMKGLWVFRSKCLRTKSGDRKSHGIFKGYLGLWVD